MKFKEVVNKELETSITSISQNFSCLENEKREEPGDITKFLPEELSQHISKLNNIVQTGIDTLVTTNLSVLASLSSGTILFDKKDDSDGTAIIIYSASFFKSGGGKTVSVTVNRKYFLDWLELEFNTIQEKTDRSKRQIEIELKTLGNSIEDRKTKARLEEELVTLATQPDVYLEDATSEGFEASIACNSSPFLFIDNFGKYILASSKSEHKANMLRMLDNIFDSGRTTTRRLKGEDKRAAQLTIKSLGAHFASTLGDSNLKPKDIKSNIENGFFNKVLITFQDTIDKPIPLKTSLTEKEKYEIEKFARDYHRMASTCDFYLSDEAYTVYKTFHQRTSDEFIYRYNNDEDLSGMIIRLLKIAKRIACIFQISEQCNNYLYKQIRYDDIGNKYKEPIHAVNMTRAIGLIEHLKEEHISKIMLYAESQNGKLGKHKIILHAIQRIHNDKKNIDNRSIIARLSKAQRMPTDELISILHKLVQDKKIKLNENGKYELLQQ